MKNRFVFAKVHLRDRRNGVAKLPGILAILALCLNLWFTVANTKSAVFVRAEPLPQIIELHALFRGLATHVSRDRREILVVLQQALIECVHLLRRPSVRLVTLVTEQWMFRWQRRCWSHQLQHGLLESNDRSYQSRLNRKLLILTHCNARFSIYFSSILENRIVRRTINVFECLKNHLDKHSGFDFRRTINALLSFHYVIAIL